MLSSVAETSSRLAVYRPTPECPWNVGRVVHLHRRAGFAASWEEIERDLRDGPGPTIDRLLNGTAYCAGRMNDFEATSTRLAEAAVRERDPKRLQAWWLHRMIWSPDPLGEKLALLWHNHFATSNHKLDDLELMFRQNQLFRQLGRGRFGDLLTAVVKDPAILLWLDAPSNRKEHPNENLGRELMELFSLGVGNYSETDVKEAARALTGWDVTQKRFQFEADHHDAGSKTILDQTGSFDGDGLLSILIAHPATSRRLARRLCGMLMAPVAVGDEHVEELASELRRRELNIAWGVETVLRSQAFFADENIGANVLSPVEYVVGAIRALECFDPAPSTLLLAEWTDRMGQSLFYPPNVFGWPGGKSWISTRSLLMRAMFAEQLVDGAMCRPVLPFDRRRSAARHCQNRNRSGQIEFITELLIGSDPRPVIERLRNESGSGPQKDLGIHEIVKRALSAPEAQLG